MGFKPSVKTTCDCYVRTTEHLVDRPKLQHDGQATAESHLFYLQSWDNSKHLSATVLTEIQIMRDETSPFSAAAEPEPLQ